ncbi:DUF4492 domain-containing protein [Nitratifractor salsuginis]|uniref:DUF4492 domain-containing protein n=1 Tax=Nitratifractor salsuginis (strain DSM 16511 / JCM 12458 / E9I37-1) TaxID=749222 RepID=E6X1D7_NITSE|nr:DUF4492 domain-containing protein [Nitratifractor salsuginis]ADV45870.1 hypothetical protein Nitsa_0602 [Nitratifractor salsuginis DSM 16511]
MHLLGRIYRFYRDGFASMRLGKKLWLIVALKLFVLFVVIKLLFFPNVLQEYFSTDRQRSDFVLHQLTQGAK